MKKLTEEETLKECGYTIPNFAPYDSKDRLEDNIIRAMRQFAAQKVKTVIKKRDEEIEVWMEKEKYSMPSSGEESWVINHSELIQFLHSKQETKNEKQ